MSYKKIKLKDLADVVSEMLKESYEAVDKAVDKSIKKTRNKARRQVKDLSNRSDIAREKHYADDWTTKLESSRAPLIKRVTVHNRQYQLTHLLEHGHFVFNQHGGAYGRTRAFPHVGPTQEMADEMFEEELIKELEKLL